jgi:type II secretory pathway pseudopilin PulG
MRCPKCTFTNEPEAFACISCGMSLRASSSPPSFSSVSQNKNEGMKQGLAIASLVLGVASIALSFFCIGFLLVIPGIVTGIIALVKIKKEPARFGGKGLAIGGIVTSCVPFLFIPIVAAIAIPNLLAARKAANESAAIGRLHTIANAQVTYNQNFSKYGTLKELTEAKLLENMEPGTVRSGYKMTLLFVDEKSYQVIAIPETPSSGARSFYLSQDGAIHFSRQPGITATADDPTLGSSQR